MEISNTISYDSTYSKSDLSQLKTKQSVPGGKEKSHFVNKLDRMDLYNKENHEEKSDAIDKSNEILRAFDRKLEISVHKKTREVMVKVIDTITDEVIREIPPEKVLDVVASRKEMLGMLVDKKI